jgi:predicted dehydrogenase
MAHYRVALVGCGRMGGTIDDEVQTYPSIVLPYSHAAAYATVPQTQLVAIADIDEARLAAFGERWGVPPEHRYTDYRTMIEAERPDILSITTRAPLHAAITMFAAEHGVKGIYCEKPMCCSMAEADAMVEAVERNNVKFNLGTSRRWSTGVDAILSLISEGRLGTVRSVICYGGGSLLHTGSHWIDLLMRLAGDPPATSVQGTVDAGDQWDGQSSRIDYDLSGTGIIQFANGIRGYYLSGGPSGEFEVCGTAGIVRILDNGLRYQLRLLTERPGWRQKTFEDAPFPWFERKSNTVRIIEDLIQAIETDGTTRGNVRIARAGMEIALGFVESHRRGGARVSLPLEDRALWMASV